VWTSEKDAGLYFSIVLRPALDPKYLSLLTLMAGIAVSDTLKELGLTPDIKWVNDILVNERKISGILAETTETFSGLAVIVGIGINILRSNILPELAETATSIDHHADAPKPAELIDILLKHLERFYELLQLPGGNIAIIEEWKRRSTFFNGKQVMATIAGETLIGTTDGLEPNGALRVKTSEGELRIIQAGEIQMLRPQ
jgi:BirA family biotin operon repressor/biotin-[acetyl-CoA-carboxylase] ligase